MSGDTASNVNEDDDYPMLSKQIDAGHRRRLFVEEYMRNGQQTAAAAEALGYGRTTGKQLINMPPIMEEIERRSRAVAAVSRITTEEWAENLRAVAYFDVRELFDADGVIIPSHKLPRHVAKAIASVQYTEKVDRAGNVVARVSTVTFADKNTALITMAKHLGLFERDNSQRGPDLQLVVNLVE